MPKRVTKRGDERTPLDGDWDVLICGASFAGLAVARELTGSRARVLVVDRYAIGERQTSACGIPTDWLPALGVEGALQQTFPELVIHSPHADVRLKLPWSFSTFDYRTICALLWEQCDADFETAKVESRVAGSPADGEPIRVLTDRGELRAPLVVDALGWRRLLDEHYQPPDAPLSRGLEVHPEGSGEDLEIWIDRDVVPAGYGWNFPAGSEQRVGVGSFDPHHHVKDPTVRLAEDLGVDTVRYQGNWIPHKIRAATGGAVFFAGDSAGHCLPLTAEGIRTALYFGGAAGREIRAVLEGAKTRSEALGAYGEFSAAHEWKFRWMLRAQRLVPRIPPRLLGLMLRRMQASPRFVAWAFRHYLRIAPPPEGTAARPRRAKATTPAIRLRSAAGR